MLFQYSMPVIYNALVSGESCDILPRLTEKDIKNIRTSPHFEKNLKYLLESGVELATKPLTTLKYSHYRQFDETGVRGGETDEVYKGRRVRLTIFALLSILYPEEPGHIKHLEDIIWAICDEYTWAPAAHQLPMGTDVRVPKARYNEKGLIVNSSYSHSEQLDLFACETGFALCEITALLESRLAPLVVYRARTECYRRILTPYMDLTGLWKWEKHNNNWAAVCGGSIGMVAMYLIKDSSVLTPVLIRIIATLDAYLGAISDDGACVEGPSYWRYGMSFFSGFAETLRKRTNGEIDLFNYEKVRRIAEFKQNTYLTGSSVVSFSDSARNISFRLGLSVFLKNEYNTVRVPDLKYASAVLDIFNISRWCTDYRDIYWAKDFDFVNDENGNQTHVLYEQAQQFVSKRQVKASTYCFAVKGGHNAQPHNHNDIGSFIYHIDGDTLLADFGRASYSKAYSRPETRYSFICNCSRGHSVPIVDGCYQMPGREHECTRFTLDYVNETYNITIDIKNAYDLPHLKSLVRNISFANDGSLLVSDTCTADKPIAFKSRFVSYFPIKMEEGKVLISGEKVTVQLEYDMNKADVSFSEDSMQAHEDGDANGIIPVYMVDFSAKHESINHEITVKISKVL